MLSGSALRAGPAGQIPLSRAMVLNVSPVVVIPAAVGCAALVPSRPLRFLLAGALASGLYVVVLGVVAAHGPSPWSKQHRPAVGQSMVGTQYFVR